MNAEYRTPRKVINSSKKSSLDPEEIARFTKVSSQWWDENGPFKPLHQLNPTRIRFIRNQIMTHFGRSVDSSNLPDNDHNEHPTPSSHTLNSQIFQGLSVLDVGCGGGLVCEPLCRLGAKVTGVDGSEPTIDIAKAHSALSELNIDYQATTVESLAEKGEKFDVVLALEIVEHVADVAGFVASCAAVVKPGGLIIFSTLNRTIKSYLVAIVGAEYIVQWVPKGTHEWSKFLTPAELAAPLREQGLILTDIRGMIFNPLKWGWELSSDTDVNYFMTAVKGK